MDGSVINFILVTIKIQLLTYMIKSQLRSSVSESTDSIYQKLKAIKYPVRPISNAMYLDKKINSFPNAIQLLLKKEIAKQLNAYRQVRGDGNCFIRAFAFTFIANKRNTSFDDIFTLIDKVKLDNCKLKSIPQSFRPFYQDKKLKAVLRKRWDQDYQFFLRTNDNNYRRALSRMFNENHYLDFLVVLYFRAVCVWVLQSQEQYKQFLSSEAQEITTYGCESEGVTINLCSSYFHMNIRILEVRAHQVIPYDYMVLKNTFVGLNNQVDLLYSDAHYDIIEKNDNPAAQYEDQKMEEEYYSEIRLSYALGTCVQCNRKTEIAQQTGLCNDCFNKSLQNLNSFQKDSQILGECGQCRRKTKISQDLLMCEDCIQKLQNSSISGGSRVKEQPQQQQHHGDYFKSMKCISCKEVKRFDEIGTDKICNKCLSKQKMEKPDLSHINPDSIISLKGKLESKISRQEREEEEQKKVMQAQIRSKTKMVYEYRCKQCHTHKVVASEQQLHQYSDMICDGCRKESEIRVSYSGMRSGIKIKCKVCGPSETAFPLKNGICSKCQTKRGIIR